MDLEKHGPPPPHEGGEGCVTTLVRMPVRIVVLVLVLPVRMLWDLLVVGGRALERVLLRPLGRALQWVYDHVLAPVGRALVWLALALLVRPWVGLWRYVAVPVARYGVVVPLVWLHRALLTPAGHGLRWLYDRLLVPAVTALVTVLLVWPAAGVWRYLLKPVGTGAHWLVTHLLVLPGVWVYRYVLTPVGHGVTWTLRTAGRGLRSGVVWLVMTLFVLPLGWVYRCVLAPLGREIVAAVGVAWRIAGFISRAVGRVLAWLAWHLAGAPVTWVYRAVCTPVGHFLRDAVWAPTRQAALEAGRAARGALASARETFRAARRDAWRALLGRPQVADARELEGSAARTLGRTTTVPSVAPVSEISLLDVENVERG
ncbi:MULTISPECIES: hypothetical protein [unclassified Streptomyces]|uniref:hypothetical protein n=1 Tax=unclassified Streptomyces TaxID=2593676 RepID=UPI0004C522BD|nr:MULTISPECIES: hypothetical protein [unclassified Streptomyces]KPC84881.1 membrane protein [Streptomyces sp. NRRL S-4]